MSVLFSAEAEGDLQESAGSTSSLVVRLWPAWVLLIFQSIVFALSITSGINNAVRFGYMMLGPAVGSALFIVWLLLASQLAWPQRFTLTAVIIAVPICISPLVHDSLKLGLLLYGAPLSMLAVVAGLWVTERRADHRQGKTIVCGLLVIWGLFPLGRIDGFRGNYLPELAWRWSPTPEQLLIAEETAPSVSAVSGWSASDAEWPGFRGMNRDSVAVNSRGTIDWSTSSPIERWRVPVGPGWSSFAFAAGRLFTQEQRGKNELVTCYDAETGALIWAHGTDARFSEVVSGAGPRATPTLSGERLFSLGATGVFQCLNSANGELIWQRDLREEFAAPVPMWGFSSSPLVVEGRVVVVYAGADDENGLMGFDTTTGEVVWRVASAGRGINYSSPQSVELAGQRLVVFGDAEGLFALKPTTGDVVWRYRPTDWSGPAVCQPQLLDDNSLIVPLGDGIGLARLQIDCGTDGSWQIQEKWSTNRLKPSFNDFLLHRGNVYGFDQNIFVSLDAKTGRRNWKRGRYGFGQAILLPMVDQMIVTTEQGDLTVVAADPERHVEHGRIPALGGKTWNHPIVVDDRLYVRNGEFAVCYELDSSSAL